MATLKITEDPVSLLDAKDLLRDCFAAHWSVMLESSPGVGKSAIVKELAADMNYYLLDLRMSTMVPEDLNGLPSFKEINGVQRACYSPMDFWPLASDPLPEGKDGVVIFLDEFNTAPPTMIAAAYRILLDHEVGGHALHPKAVVVLAGNLLTDNALATHMGTAASSRMSRIRVKPSHQEVIEYASRNGWDSRVLAYLNFAPGKLHAFNPEGDQDSFPCPRTWEATSDLCKQWPKGPVQRAKRPLLSGTVGVGTSHEFVNFTKVWRELPDIHSIIRDPESYQWPADPGVRHATAGLVAENLKADNAEALMKYILRMGPDFQVIVLRQAIARDMQLLRSPAISEWTKTNRTRLLRQEAA
jgi:hypothetical protein